MIRIYALLVGIDKYVNVPPLKGCVNDVIAIQEYLQARVVTNGYELHLRTRLNQNATRQAIIDGFRQHLCQANSEDVAFFYYSGHGSQEQAPQEFFKIEPDGLNETLVCYDSRSEGGWDLADKELAKLIAEVADKNPHITIILDSCHSGSGSRDDQNGDTAVRQVPMDLRKRPVDSFIFTLTEAEQLVNTRSQNKNPTGWNLARGKHILLAACRDIERAKEYNFEGQRRGVFSYFLLDTLTKANGNLSYRDLFKRTNSLVRSKTREQSPQMEATVVGDLEQAFLGGAIVPRTPYFTVSYHQEYNWIIDGGAVHGIPQPSGDETTLLALFPFDSIPELSVARGEARVIQVMPQLSKIQISGVENLTVDMIFKAVVTSLPLPPRGVLITGEEAGVKFARTALQTSIYVREVTTPDDAEFKLLAHNGKYLITRPVDETDLVSVIEGYNPRTACLVVQRLEYITRWMNIAELSSFRSSCISADAVQMMIYQGNQELKDTDIRWEYRRENGRWIQPTFKIKLKNHSQKSLYCAVLNLTEQYSINSGLFPAGGVWLKPGEEAWALDGKNINADIPNELWRQGITESHHIYKLIVSTAEFDVRLLEQDKLNLASNERYVGEQRGGTLNRLMKSSHQREIRAKHQEYDDWITSQIAITIIRPLDTVAIPRDDQSVSLASGVSLRCLRQTTPTDSTFKANVRLTAEILILDPQFIDDLNNSILPSTLQKNKLYIQPFLFTNTRGLEPNLDMLELRDVENPSVVTASEPLIIIVDQPLAPQEQLLSFSYDGDRFLILGYAQRTFGGKTEIILERLPNTPVGENRNPGNSIRILFRKIVSR